MNNPGLMLIAFPLRRESQTTIQLRPGELSEINQLIRAAGGPQPQWVFPPTTSESFAAKLSAEGINFIVADEAFPWGVNGLEPVIAMTISSVEEAISKLDLRDPRGTEELDPEEPLGKIEGEQIPGVDVDTPENAAPRTPLPEFQQTERESD